MHIEQRYTDAWGNLLAKAIINPGDSLKSTLKMVSSEEDQEYSELECLTTARCGRRFGLVKIAREEETIFAEKLEPGKVISKPIRGYTGREFVEWEFKPPTPPTP